MKPEDRAIAHIKNIQGFYRHCLMFCIMVPMFLLVRYLLIPSFIEEISDQGFQKWLHWNTLLMPAIWALVLGIHGIVVFWILPRRNAKSKSKSASKFSNENQSRWK